ncbi:Ionotropic glutamate receptor [Trinorchestia longiramus]|nr:Ionotropic glutamate receptor [Trinorchestia longiramus]
MDSSPLALIVTDWRWPRLLRLRSSSASLRPLPPTETLGDTVLELIRRASPLPPLVVLVCPSPEFLLQLETLEKPVFKKLPLLILLCQSTLPLLYLPLDNLVTFGMVSSSNDDNVETISLIQQYSVAPGYHSSTSIEGTWSRSTGVVGSPSDEGLQVGKIDEWAYLFSETLAAHLNFTCSYKESEDGEYGTLRDDGSWTGMVGDVTAGKGDIIVSHLDNTITRSQVVHFLLPNEMTGTVMIMKRTKSLDSSLSRYTNVFSSGVWWTLMASLTTMTLVNHFVIRNSPDEHHWLTISESLMEVIAAFGLQGHVRTYNSNTSRVTLLVTSLSTFLVVAHYSSWLSAMLTVQTTSYPFHGFQSVLDDGTYVMGIVDGWSTKTEIQCSKDPLLQSVWTQLTRDKGLVCSLNEGLQRALDEKLILLTSKASFLLDDSFDKNLFTVLPGVYFLWPSGFVVAKGSPYTETLNKG